METSTCFNWYIGKRNKTLFLDFPFSTSDCWIAHFVYVAYDIVEGHTINKGQGSTTEVNKNECLLKPKKY